MDGDIDENKQTMFIAKICDYQALSLESDFKICFELRDVGV